jgi:adenylyltransferase/sulfurtransferase
MNEMAESSARNRYSRQTMFSGIGDEGQEKLGKSFAVIVGCGALGTNIASLLVRAGVGRVRIIDRDFIEYHNLQRQVLFDEDDIKARLPKAIAAERHLKMINSLVKVEGIASDFNYTNAERLCAGADVILDGLDNIETRFLINDVSLKHGIPWVYGGAIMSHGMTMTIVPGEPPCFRCIHSTLPATRNTMTCETVGIVGTVPAIIGALQATEAIKLLVGSKDINRKLIAMNVWKNSFESLTIAPNESCPACKGRYEFLERRFDIKVTSLCGQSRALQVVDSGITEIALEGLEKTLSCVNNIVRREFMLDFTVDGKEISVFPDGRAIIKNTLDESQAKELYIRYIAGPGKAIAGVNNSKN